MGLEGGEGTQGREGRSAGAGGDDGAERRGGGRGARAPPPPRDVAKCKRRDYEESAAGAALQEALLREQAYRAYRELRRPSGLVVCRRVRSEQSPPLIWCPSTPCMNELGPGRASSGVAMTVIFAAWRLAQPYVVMNEVFEDGGDR